MSLVPGVRLGPYEIRGTLGAGGMGTVYRALDTNPGRQVAIKTRAQAEGSIRLNVVSNWQAGLPK